jgi:hypothetical protein
LHCVRPGESGPTIIARTPPKNSFCVIPGAAMSVFTRVFDVLSRRPGIRPWAGDKSLDSGFARFAAAPE